MSQPTNTIRPYADSIQGIHGEKHSWLVNYLRRGYNDRYWAARDPHIDVYIMDSIDGFMTRQHFHPHRSDEVDSQFQAALDTRPPNSRTRLVLVQGGQLGDMNAAYLDAIGNHYQLGPSFFYAYLEVALLLTEKEQIRPTSLPVSLPSENDYILVSTETLNSFAIASIDNNNDQTTSKHKPFACGHDC